MNKIKKDERGQFYMIYKGYTIKSCGLVSYNQRNKKYMVWYFIFRKDGSLINQRGFGFKDAKQIVEFDIKK